MERLRKARNTFFFITERTLETIFGVIERNRFLHRLNTRKRYLQDLSGYEF